MTLLDIVGEFNELYELAKSEETLDDHEYSTTGEKRTGCSMCGFGIQMETRPHRFDRLYERNPSEWEFWMTKCCKHEDGTPFGWGEVLDYIGISWRDPEHWWLDNGYVGQATIFDYLDSDGNLIEIN